MSPNLARRNPRTERAVLDAALSLMEETSLLVLTIEGIAGRAGVGKQTVYRWWPSTGAIAIDVLLREADPQIGFPDTGDLRADFTDAVGHVVALLADPRLGRHFVACLVESRRDPALAERFAERVFVPVRTGYRQRLAAAQGSGEIAAGVALDDLLDLAFGAVWLRALTRSDELDGAFAGRLTALLLDGAAAPHES